MELEIPAAGGKRHLVLRPDGPVVNKNVFHNHIVGNDHRRDRARVDEDGTVDGREPQRAVRCAPAGRLNRPVAFACEHPVVFSECDAVDGWNRARGEVFQILSGYTDNSLVGADPERAQAVIEDLHDVVRRQSLFRRIHGDLAVPVSVQSIPECAKPEGPGPVLVHRDHRIARKPIAHVESIDGGSFELSHTVGKRGEPQRPGAVGLNAPDRKLLHTRIDLLLFQCGRIERHRAASRPNPHGAALIGRDRIDRTH